MRRRAGTAGVRGRCAGQTELMLMTDFSHLCRAVAAFRGVGGVALRALFDAPAKHSWLGSRRAKRALIHLDEHILNAGMVGPWRRPYSAGKLKFLVSTQAAARQPVPPLAQET